MSLTALIASDAVTVVCNESDFAESSEYVADSVTAPVTVSAVWSEQPRQDTAGAFAIEDDKMIVFVPASHLVDLGQVVRADSDAQLVRYPTDLSAREVWWVTRASRQDGLLRFESVRRG